MALVKSINKSGLILFTGINLCKLAFENDTVTFSPLSCNMALLGTLFGCDGNSKKQLADALHVKDFDTLIEEFQLLTGVSNCDLGHTIVKLVNALYVHEGFPLGEPFMKDIKQIFDVKTANFLEPAKEMQNINEFVSSNTAGKIPNLLTGDAVKPTTRVILVNALYFKSKWEQPFESTSTFDQQFTKLSNEKVTVKMMNQEETFPYYEDGYVQVIKMAYKDKKYSMLIVLPKSDPNYLFPTADQYEHYVTKCDYEDVRVGLPKFRHESKHSLVQHFQNLGVTDLFNVGGLQRMHKELYVDDIVQAVVVEVDEDGTEAAASTAVICDMESCCMKKSKRFCCNKPFSYFIRNVQTNAILFCGIHNG